MLVESVELSTLNLSIQSHKKTERCICISLFNGAGEGTRTPDQLFTKQLLYQLSYTGSTRYCADYTTTTRNLSIRRDS